MGAFGGLRQRLGLWVDQPPHTPAPFPATASVGVLAKQLTFCMDADAPRKTKHGESSNVSS